MRRVCTGALVRYEQAIRQSGCERPTTTSRMVTWLHSVKSLMRLMRPYTFCLVAIAQGLTLDNFSPQLEPCLTEKHPTHPKHPLNTGYTIPTRTPYPIKALKLS